MANHLHRHGSNYRVLIGVPARLQHIIGKKVLCRNLGTPNYKAAKKASGTIVREFQERLANAEKVLAGAMTPEEAALQDRDLGHPPEVTAELAEFLANENLHAWGKDGGQVYKDTLTGKRIPLRLHYDTWQSGIRTEKARYEFGKIIDELEVFLKGLKHDALNLVTRSDVEKWKAKLRESGYADATINKRLAAAQSLFNHAMDHDTIAVNPFQKKRIKNPVQRVEREYFSDADLVRAFELATPQQRRELAIGLLGMRIGAQWMVRAEHVLEIDGIHVIRVLKQKRETRDRLIPIPEVLLPLVRLLVEESPRNNGYLFPAPAAISKYKNRGSQASREWSRFFRSHDFPDSIVFHSLRHHSAHVLERSGSAENVGARTLGHSQGITNQRYSGPSNVGVLPLLKAGLDAAFSKLPARVLEYLANPE